MQPTQKQRDERYQTLTQSGQELYAGEAAGKALRKTFNDFHLPEEIYYEYTQAFGDVILGFEDEARLPRVLEERLGLSEKLATVIAHDLLEYINTHKVSATATSASAPVLPVTPPSTAPVPPLAAPVASAPEEPPSWSRRIAPAPPSLPTESRAAPQTPPQVPRAPVTPSPSQSPVPPYAKPYTDVPRYIPDPYREPPK